MLSLGKLPPQKSEPAIATSNLHQYCLIKLHQEDLTLLLLEHLVTMNTPNLTLRVG